MRKQTRSIESIWHELLLDIKEGQYMSDAYLPSEMELATRLGISRTQLRDGLAILEQNGFITRRRGVGAAINRHVADIKTRIDLEVEFLDMIAESGYKPGAQLLGVETIRHKERAAQRLGVSSSSQILAVTKLITADGRPAILCTDHIAYEKIKRFDYTPQELELPIFHFIENYCLTSIYMDITEIKPVNADSYLSQTLRVAEGSALLYLDEVAYNQANDIILYSEEYYVDGILNHMVLRKKI